MLNKVDRWHPSLNELRIATPSTTLLYAAALIVAASIAFARRFLYRKLTDAEQSLFITKIKHSDHILSGFGPDQKLTPLESRALPNLRLMEVFDIQNSFTTADENFHKEFRKRVESHLRLTEVQWEATVRRAQMTISSYLKLHLKQAKGSGPTVPLVPMVRVVVLKVILGTIVEAYPADSPPIDQEYRMLEQVADIINRLWILSKSEGVSSDSKSLLDQLNLLLRQLLPEARDYPLNIILPSFETMWRVVIRGIMELRFRDSETWQFHYHQMFKDILSDPSQQAMKKLDFTNAVSIDNIVNEILRLYPPTRRIYRAISALDGCPPSIVGVDVESLHRDSGVWGKDSLYFRPSRWRNGLSKVQQASFFPFGKKKFICPAKSSFAPRMLAILVGAISTGMGNEVTLSWGQERNSFAEKEPISNHRGDLESLSIFFSDPNRLIILESQGDSPKDRAINSTSLLSYPLCGFPETGNSGGCRHVGANKGEEVLCL